MYLSNKAKTIIGIVAGVVVIAGVIGGSIAIANAVKKNKQANCEHVYLDSNASNLSPCSLCSFCIFSMLKASFSTEIKSLLF